MWDTLRSLKIFVQMETNFPSVLNRADVVDAYSETEIEGNNKKQDIITSYHFALVKANSRVV